MPVNYPIANSDGATFRTNVNNSLAEVLPVGMVAPFAGTAAPSGWLECDGSAISRTTYSDLFTALGTLYGVGDGSTTFNLPDLRGQFLRGWNHGAGTDPDAASRTDRGDGTTGDNVGTKQADENKSHTHITSGDFWRRPATDYVISLSTGTWDNLTTDPETSASGGNESRPKNVSVMFCIKY